MYNLKTLAVETGKSNYCVFEAVRRKFVNVIENIRNKTIFFVFFFSFNCRLQDLFQQEKGRKRPSVPPSPGRLRQGEESKVRKCRFGAHFPYPLKTASPWLSRNTEDVSPDRKEQSCLAGEGPGPRAASPQRCSTAMLFSAVLYHS